MLQFLLPSKVRRRLFLLLWAERAEGSVSGLAERAGVGFASAHRELRAMHRFDLVKLRHEGRRDVYAANSEHPSAHTLRRLASMPPDAAASQAPESLELRRSLRALGAPLTVAPSDAPPPDKEAVLAQGVQLAHRDPTVARSLPLCFWQLREELDPERLALQAKHLGEKRALGFFLDLTGRLSGDPRFVAWAKPLRDRRVKRQDPFFLAPAGEGAEELSRRATPGVARKWGFWMNMSLDTFQSLFDKFAGEA